MVNTSAKQAIKRVTQNKITHIMQSKHAWKLVTSGGCTAVSKIIKNVITNGNYYINSVGNKVYSMAVGKYTVEVVTRMVNGVITVVDAWVKTR